jgi:hypothetical protein
MEYKVEEYTLWMVKFEEMDKPMTMASNTTHMARKAQDGLSIMRLQATFLFSIIL